MVTSLALRFLCKSLSQPYRLKNLRVIDIPAPAVHALADLADRNMEFQCLIQDGQTQWMNDKGSVTSANRPLVTPGGLMIFAC
jgi:uncharacterized protein YaeQ